MSGFSSDWLALREPADHRARRDALLDELPPPTEGRARRVVDLGTGTGSNLRYLMPRLGAQQQWRLIDNDPALLSELPSRLAPWASAHGLNVQRDADHLRIDGARLSASVATQALDLAGPLDELRLDEADLVSCSALLDLFSPERLGALAGAIARARCPVLFSLSYDGRVAWSPTLPFDATATALLNAHQRRDKGLGGSAGPDAGAMMVDALREHGYRVIAEPADWQLSAAQAPLQRALIDGWEQALREQQPDQAEAVAEWHAERCALIDEGTGEIHVGHLDIVATPP